MLCVCDGPVLPINACTRANHARYSSVHASLVRFNKIGRENNRINNRNNGPGPENNRGG